MNDTYLLIRFIANVIVTPTLNDINNLSFEVGKEIMKIIIKKLKKKQTENSIL